jgi:hypothetical protein
MGRSLRTYTILVHYCRYDGKRFVPSWVVKKELTQYLQNPEKTAAPKEISQASKPSGYVAYVCKVDLADIVLSAETAALEDGLINALQHRSIRSILGTATNVYCFGVDGGRGNEAPCLHFALARAQLTSILVFAFVVQPACPVQCTCLVLCGSRRAAQGGREPSYSYSRHPLDRSLRN